MTRIWTHAPLLIALASIAVLGTALASQYLGGLAPCKLCHWQRWPYIFTIVAGLGAWAVPAARRWLVAACAVAFAVGGAIAVYHAGVEYGWFAGPTSCSGTGPNPASIEELRRQLLAQPVVRCDEPQWTLFGISLAGYNVIASVALAGGSLLAFRHLRRGGRP